MTPEEHKARHVELRQALDELVVDWAAQTKSLPSKRSVIVLMQWAYRQAEDPTEAEGAHA